MSFPANASGEPTCDVHAHYLPREAIALMSSGMASIRLEDVGGVPESITLGGMPVGSSVGQLSSIELMTAAMESAGISHRVLSPPPFTYRYWSDPDDSLRLCRLLNDAHARLVADHPERFSGLCTVPLQDVDLAIGELERAIDDLGLHGVTLGTNVAGHTIADPSLRPFLAAVAGKGVPILVHPDFVPNPRLADHYLVNLVGMPTESAIVLADLILSGVLEELPDLRICFVHGGGSAPYLLGRLVRGWHVRPETRRHTSKPPDAYLHNVFFDSLTHSDVALDYLVDLVGSENVVIGTDSPFDVEDPAPLNGLDRLGGVDRENVAHRSASRWLRADIGSEVA